jgi:hypothetical protein
VEADTEAAMEVDMAVDTEVELVNTGFDKEI